MTGYALVSSVCLLQINSRPTPRLTESPFGTLFIGPVNSLLRRLSIVLRTRTIKFKGDHFSRRIIRAVYGGYVCTRGIVPHEYAIGYRKGDQIIWGIGYLVTLAAADNLWRPPPTFCDRRAAADNLLARCRCHVLPC